MKSCDCHVILTGVNWYTEVIQHWLSLIMAHGHVTLAGLTHGTRSCDCHVTLVSLNQDVESCDCHVTLAGFNHNIGSCGTGLIHGMFIHTYVPQVAYQKIQRARLKASGGKVMQQKETEVPNSSHTSTRGGGGGCAWFMPS